MNKKISTVGIDLAKNVFQIHAADSRGKVIVRKRVNREGLRQFIGSLSACVVAMEACGGAHYWGRIFEKAGHTVRLISPQFVKPYVKANKNDMADAEAIVEAALRPGMRFVPVKQVWQQEVLALHRVRDLLMRDRTALMNQMRGLLQEHGVVLPRGRSQLEKGIFRLLSYPGEISPSILWVVEDLYARLVSIERKAGEYEERIVNYFQENEGCQRLGSIPGVGPLTATALIATIGNAHHFKNGRQMAAWLGLVPRQNSSGGKTVLLGISKRGDSYVRKLLVHGARSVLCNSHRKGDRRARWALKKARTRGFNKACVALANKTTRLCWALLVQRANYKMSA